MNKTDIKFHESKTKKYYVTDKGEIYSVHNTTNNTKKLKTSLNNNNTLFINLDGKKPVVHNIVWESYNGEIPKNKLVLHEDNNPYNCELNNLYLSHKGKELNKDLNINVPVVVFDGNTPPRHFKTLEDLAVFLNRNTEKYNKTKVIKIMNKNDIFIFDEWQVTTCEYEYGEKYPDVIWDEAFPQYDDYDDCVIINFKNDDWM
jgi:hypothetical protein